MEFGTRQQVIEMDETKRIFDTEQKAKQGHIGNKKNK